MKQIELNKLDRINGGNTSVSGPIINAIVGVINVLKEAGYALGSGIRRLLENNMCPLE